jgi:uncharacterized protein (TIGR04255 family)
LPSATEVRTYRNPSVHEVVADVLFESELADKAFSELPGTLADFGKAVPLESQTLGVISAPGFPSHLEVSKGLAGWQFAEGDAPKWFLRVLKNRFTVNMARSDAWPKGDYVGWWAIAERLGRVVRSLSPYASLTARRLGLRYINRFSVPTSTALSDWSNVQLVLPASLSRQLGSSLRTTIAALPGNERFAASISLVQEDGKHLSATQGETPFLLDIDVFNLQPTEAPKFEGFIDWFESAHRAENAVFELCITDKLRQRFDGA